MKIVARLLAVAELADEVYAEAWNDLTDDPDERRAQRDMLQDLRHLAARCRDRIERLGGYS